ncbi:hypothetical protein V6N13_148950 [Hibiscus sabdariffa]|uniref:Uncharacterized protein n=1 Tax=Hibiscus sabdariffa TaxID=183260 RepID=A0ABR2EMJ6_9ROSI
MKKKKEYRLRIKTTKRASSSVIVSKGGEFEDLILLGERRSAGATSIHELNCLVSLAITQQQQKLFCPRSQQLVCKEIVIDFAGMLEWGVV